MEKISCSVITQNIRDLAKELNLNAPITNNLVSTWQTIQKTIEIPSAKELKEFKEKLSNEELLNIYLALPEYTAIDYKDGGKLAYTTSNGEIIITKFLKVKDRSFFEDYIFGKIEDNPTSEQKQQVFKILEKEGYTIDKIRELLPDNSSIYRFLLWHEMSHVENNDKAKYWNKGKDLLTEDKIEIEYKATLEALQKAEKYNKVYGKRSPKSSETDYSSILSEESVKSDLTTFLSPLYTEFTSLERNRRVATLAKDFNTTIDSLIEDITYDLEDKLEETSSEKERVKIKNRLINYKNEESKYIQYFSENSIETIIDKLVEKYSNKIKNTKQSVSRGEISEEKGQEIETKVQKIINNIRPLVYFASPEIGFMLGVEVTLDTKNKSGNSIEDITDEDAEENPIGDTSWAFKARKASTYDGFSASARRVLGNLKLERGGKYLKDDIGEYIYLNPRTSYINLITEAAGKVVRPEDFSIDNKDGSYSLPFLENILHKYPEFRGLISTLKYEPRLISNFYNVLNVSYVNHYGIRTSRESGKLVPIHLNRPNKITLLTHLIDSNFNSGVTFSPNSIYNSEGRLIVDNINKGLNILSTVEDNIASYVEDKDGEIIDVFTKTVNMLGVEISETEIAASIGTTEEDIKTFYEKLYNIYRKLQKDIKEDKEVSSVYDLAPKLFRELFSKLIYNTVTNDALTFVTKGNRQLLSYQHSDNMELVLNTLKDPSKVLEYLENEFGYDEFLYDAEKSKYRNYWLEYLKLLAEEGRSFENIFDTQELQDIDGKEYKDWTEQDLAMANIKMFFAPTIQEGMELSTGDKVAYYLTPIGSDSETAKFISFARFEVEELIPKFREVVKQELSRISSVQKAEDKKGESIANFDKRGKEFCFFPELNNLEIGGKKFIEIVVDLNNSNNIDKLDSFIDNVLGQVLETEFKQFKSILTATSSEELKDYLIEDKNISKEESDALLDNYLKTFFYNSFYANTQLIQIMTTDLAYYKNAIDFQKRWKQVLAAGIRLNTNSEYGKTTERSIYLKDDIITASFYSDIEKVMMDNVKKGRITKEFADSILEKYREVNATDAQSYRTLESYRSVLDMQGKWTDEMQECFDRLKDGTWDMGDLSIVWQTLKPFMFATTKMVDSNGKAHRVGVQHKNSEVLLLQLYSFLLPNSVTSSKLRALNQYMVENDIDVAHFESAVKVGKRGPIDLSYSPTKLKKWLETSIGNASYISILEEALIKEYSKTLSKEEAEKKVADLNDYSLFKEGNNLLLSNGIIDSTQYNERLDFIQLSFKETLETLEKYLGTSNNFNSSAVHELPYSSYVVQQPNPAHLKDTEALLGTQFMNMLFTNVSPEAIININGKDIKVKELKAFYDSLLVEKKLRGWEKVKEIFGSDEALSEELTRLVKGNPKYGIDTLEALSLKEEVNPETGIAEKVFVTPLNHPSLKGIVVPLLASIFKNKITKTKVKGGTATLVSSFGLTKKLRIELNKDGSIKKIPCFLPAYSKKFFEPYMDKSTGVIDISKVPEDVLKIVGYRIPTEGKYSMLPLTIVGFLPENGGTSIMLPAEITTISGADFDIDKLFMIFPSLQEKASFDFRKAWSNFYKENPDIVAKIEANQRLAFNKQVEEYLDNHPEVTADNFDLDAAFTDFIASYKRYEWAEGTIEKFKEWFKTRKSKYISKKEVVKESWNSNKNIDKQSMGAIDNALLDIAHTLLSSKHVAPEIFKPGNFDTIKREHLEKTIITNKSLLEKIIELYPSLGEDINNIKSVSSIDLKKFIDKYSSTINSANPSTFYHFHHQNMVGIALIGNYALGNVIHSKYQNKGLKIVYKETERILNIDGHNLEDLCGTYDFDGKYISDNSEEFAAASVDNAKDPVLHSLLQNPETANITDFLIKAGCTIPQISALFNSPIVKKCIDDTGSLEKLSFYIKKAEEISTSTQTPLSSTNINNSIVKYTLTGEIDATAVSAAYFMATASKKSSSISSLKGISRSDTSKGALAHSLNLMRKQVENVNKIRKSPSLYLGEALLQNNKVSYNSNISKMREVFLSSPIALLQASYSLGVEQGYNLISSYFFEGNGLLKSVLSTINDFFPSSDITEAFYLDLWRFLLSNTDTFGGSHDKFFEKRNYYLKEFPKILMKAKNSNREFNNLDVSKQLFVEEGKIKTMGLLDISRSSLNNLQSDLDYMLSSGDNTLKDLAIGLFMYNFYQNGLHINQNGLGLLFSPRFNSSFFEVDKTIRNAKNWNPTTAEITNFTEQFILNYANYLPTFDEIATTIVELPEGKLTGNLNKFPNYVQYKGKIYVRENDATYNYIGASVYEVPNNIYSYSTSNMIEIYDSVAFKKEIKDNDTESVVYSEISRDSEKIYTFSFDSKQQGLEDYNAKEGEDTLEEKMC